MALVKVGPRWLNLDHLVRCTDLLSPHNTMTLAFTDGNYVELEGLDAIAMRAFLNLQSFDLHSGAATPGAAAPEPDEAALAALADLDSESARVETAALAAPEPPITSNSRGRAISAFQQQKLRELFTELYPDQNAATGLDAFAQSEVGYPLLAATYAEGRQLTATLLRLKRDRAAASAPMPSDPVLPATGLTVAEATAAGRSAVRALREQLDQTLPRATQRATAVTFGRLTKTLAKCGWSDPALVLNDLGRALLGRAITERAPLTNAEAQALAAWLNTADAAPILDTLWPTNLPVLEPAHA